MTGTTRGDGDRLAPDQLRMLNDRMVEAIEEFRGDDPSVVLTVMCECPSPGCVDMVELTTAEFRDARARPDAYVVQPGHTEPPLDHVVARNGEHWLTAMG